MTNKTLLWLEMYIKPKVENPDVLANISANISAGFTKLLVIEGLCNVQSDCD